MLVSHSAQGRNESKLIDQGRAPCAHRGPQKKNDRRKILTQAAPFLILPILWPSGHFLECIQKNRKFANPRKKKSFLFRCIPEIFLGFANLRLWKRWTRGVRVFGDEVGGKEALNMKSWIRERSYVCMVFEQFVSMTYFQSHTSPVSWSTTRSQTWDWVCLKTVSSTFVWCFFWKCPNPNL